MPTYQYACTDCDERLEVVQKFTDDSLTECPSCSGSLRKVFNAVGVVFKGSGFYRNDSRSAQNGGSGSNSGGDSSKDSGSDGAKQGGESSGGADSNGSSGSGSGDSSGGSSGGTQQSSTSKAESAA